MTISRVGLSRYIIAVSLGFVLFFGVHSFSLASSDISYRVYQEQNSEVRVVRIPVKSDYVVRVEIATELTPLEDMAAENKAVAGINGGYFDPKNQKTTSYITQDTVLVADPRTNERLIDNPDLKQYLEKILNRSEFRRYQCGEKTRYDITFHSAAIPNECVVRDALGAGPQLLPRDTSVAEGFTAYEDGKLIRNAIGGDGLNARSAVAIAKDGDVILAMVGQKKPRACFQAKFSIPFKKGERVKSGKTNSCNSGMSLTDLAAFLSRLGATKAMNLDGGSSSSLYYQGNTYYGKLDREGNRVARPLKSVLLVK